MMYFDFKNYLAHGTRGQTPFTPAVSIILQLHLRLTQIISSGIQNEIQKTKELADYFRKHISHLPLRIYPSHCANAMTALSPTDERDASEIVDNLKNNYRILVCPNGGRLADKVFRVSHMGDMDHTYTDILIHALNDYYGVKQ